MGKRHLALIISHREIILGAVFKIAVPGEAHAIPIDDRPGHNRHLRPPTTITRRADRKPPDKYAQEHSRKGEKHSWLARQPEGPNTERHKHHRHYQSQPGPWQ